MKQEVVSLKICVDEENTDLLELLLYVRGVHIATKLIQSHQILDDVYDYFNMIIREYKNEARGGIT